MIIPAVCVSNYAEFTHEWNMILTGWTWGEWKSAEWQWSSKRTFSRWRKYFFLRCILYVVLCACSGGKLDKTNLIQFMKDLKQSHPDMTDEEAAKIAASKIADSKPKSRMYYKIGASREMAGGKKVERMYFLCELNHKCFIKKQYLLFKYSN